MSPRFCIYCGFTLKEGDSYCRRCGSPVYLDEDEKAAADAVASSAPWPSDVSSQGENATDGTTDSFSAYETSVLSDDYDPDRFYETTVFKKPDIIVIHRKTTGERFEIEPPAILGRGSKADCRILNSSIISRKHAEITREGDSYFITDLGSANKTSVGESMLSPNMPKELKDGAEFSLANEVFTFNVVFDA